MIGVLVVFIQWRRWLAAGASLHGEIRLVVVDMD
jgi:hypothetical protein